MGKQNQATQTLIQEFLDFSESLNSDEFKNIFFKLVPNETVIYLSVGISENNSIFNYPLLIPYIDEWGHKNIVFGYKFLTLNNELYLIEASRVYEAPPEPFEIPIDFGNPEYIGLLYAILKNISDGNYIAESRLHELKFFYI